MWMTVIFISDDGFISSTGDLQKDTDPTDLYRLL